MKLKTMVKRRKIALLAKKTKKEALKLTCAGFILIALIVMSYGLAEKYNLFNWLEPKTVYLKINEAKAEPVSLEIDQEKQSVEELADYIWLKESSKGTAKQGLHITCRAKGLSNEYGYNPPKCYDNNNQVRVIVEDWLKRKLETMSQEQALRLYSNNGYGLSTVEK